MSVPFTPVEVFYSVADVDAPLLEQLEHHLSVLRREGQITTWHKRQIAAGSNWQMELDQHLNTASLILLLISPAFFASDYCYGVEMQRAMQRYEAGEARVIPLLLRPVDVDWQRALFGKLKALPNNGKPITVWSNRDAAFVDIAQGIRVALDGVRHLPPSSMLSGVWNVPYRRNPHFTGRDELLDRLDQQLSLEVPAHGTTRRRTALTQPQAIKGLGGIGKTQIAVEYAYRSRDMNRYVHIFWINAASEDVLLTSVAALAELLPAFLAKGETDQQKLIEAIKRWLEQCKQRWLLIFDNADDVALVHDYLPQGDNGSILLTTRANAVGSIGARSIEVETMGFMEGTHLLLRRAQRFEHASDEEINLAGNIVVALDHFPLALDQAGAYIEETQCSLSEYLHLYESHQQVLLAQRGTQATDYPDSVATTWLLSFQKVEQINPAAAELLQLCSFFAPDRIPLELLKGGAAYWPVSLQHAVTDSLLFQQLVAELLKFSLVKRLVEEQTLSIHRLVQAVQKDRMGLETQHLWAERAVRAINEIFPDDPQNLDAWPQCLRYLDQAQACYGLIAHYELAFIEAASVLSRTSFYLEDHGLYAIAELLLKHSLVIYKQQLGSTHPTIVSSFHNLAALYAKQGKYTDAEPLLKHVLHLDEQQSGATHPDTASSLSSLAGLYYYQGKYAEAELLYLRALQINEQQLGATHLSTAQSLNNLALLYSKQGKHAEAEPLLKRALSVREQQLGATHPAIANSLNLLAALYEDQGKYAEAEPLYQRALQIDERQLGATHPDTASSLNNLAGLYYKQEKYAEAESLYQRALQINERQLDPEHPSIATILNNLAALYEEQGKYMEAESLLNRALAIQEQQLGATHPDIASSLNNLARLYIRQEKDAEAESLYQRALAICEQQLGLEHRTTRVIHKNYSLLLQALGRKVQTEQLEEGS